MESYQSKFFKLVLRLSRRKQFWQKTGEELERGIQTRRLLEFEPPGVVVQELDVEKHEQDGHFYYILQPKEQTSDLHILYLHGGAYVNRITSQHWHFLARIVEALDCKITVPLYPLAPEHTFDETYEFVLPIYNEQKPQVIMGDSAGGGLALSLCQYLKEQQLPQPEKVIAISPWLDMTMENPGIQKVDRFDRFWHFRE